MACRTFLLILYAVSLLTGFKNCLHGRNLLMQLKNSPFSLYLSLTDSSEQPPVKINSSFDIQISTLSKQEKKKICFFPRFPIDAPSALNVRWADSHLASSKSGNSPLQLWTPHETGERKQKMSPHICDSGDRLENNEAQHCFLWAENNPSVSASRSNLEEEKKQNRGENTWVNRELYTLQTLTWPCRHVSYENCHALPKSTRIT